MRAELSRAERWLHRVRGAILAGLPWNGPGRCNSYPSRRGGIRVSASLVFVSRSRHTGRHADPAPSGPARSGRRHHHTRRHQSHTRRPIHAPGRAGPVRVVGSSRGVPAAPRPDASHQRRGAAALRRPGHEPASADHQNHLRRSGSSTLRRTLAGLLLDTESYQTRRTDRVVLVDDDEIRLTAWMHTHLRLSWCEHPTPADVEATVIKQWVPPLNVSHTVPGPVLDVITAARAAYNASA